jgi:hypothetical protein
MRTVFKTILRHYSVDRGTQFEIATERAFQRLGMIVNRTGQAFDRGVDLRGRWTFIGRTVPLVAQCKIERRPIGAKYLREFQGTLMGEDPGTLGLFVSHSTYSIEAHLHLTRCIQPIVLCRLELMRAKPSTESTTEPSTQGRIVEFHMNAAAQALLPLLTVGRSANRPFCLLYNGKMIV